MRCSPPFVPVVQPNEAVSTIFCRIRKYRGLAASFGVKDRAVTFMPFTLKLTYKNGDEDSGMLIYLLVQATPLSSAFKCKYFIYGFGAYKSVENVKSRCLCLHFPNDKVLLI